MAIPSSISSSRNTYRSGVASETPHNGTHVIPRRTPSGAAGLEILLRMSRQVDTSLSQNGEHSATVADLTARMGVFLGLADQEIRDLFWAARLHDVGKVGIPNQVLSKSGPLNPKEWSLVRLHPTIGASLIAAISALAHLAPIVHSHQERFDGQGYPTGLRGQDIPLAARLLAVVDAYDAMTSNRIYRTAMPHTSAVAELKRHAGRQFDPKVVEAFLEVVELPY